MNTPEPCFGRRLRFRLVLEELSSHPMGLLERDCRIDNSRVDHICRRWRQRGDPCRAFTAIQVNLVAVRNS
jgi:hypothetical protein